jgi:hypothetical protein
MADREKLLLRLEQRKRRGSGSGLVPSLPSPPSYFNPVVNQLSEDDPVFDQLAELPSASGSMYQYRADEILANWRCGYLNIPRALPMRLIRMPEKHQYALLRSIGGDGTACGKIWAPALVFPLILADESSIIYRKIFPWIHSSNVLEVGAGWAGVPTLVASRMGAANAIITDGEDVMIQCAHINIIAELSAQKTFHSSSSPRGDLSASILRWGNASDASAILSSRQLTSIDCVIGCDCIYDTATIVQLFNSIVHDLKCHRVIFCWETRDHRYDAEETFFHQLLFQYSFRIQYFTSTLLSDISEQQTASSSGPPAEVHLACEEIRSYLDNREPSQPMSSPPDREKGAQSGNDLNFLLAERWIPRVSSPVKVRRDEGERQAMERSLSQAEEKASSQKERFIRKDSKKESGGERGCDWGTVRSHTDREDEKSTDSGRGANTKK